MTLALWLMITALLVLASGFYSGSEMGLYCVNRLRLRLRSERAGSTNANLLLRLVNRQQETVLAILIATNLVNYLATATFAVSLGMIVTIDPGHVDFYSAAILSPIIFVLGDVVPKNCFQLHADRLMYESARILRGTVVLCRYLGVSWVLQWMMRISTRLAGHDGREDWRGPRGEVVGLLREGAAAAAWPQEQSQIIERVMNLSGIRVGSIMIPRQHVVTVSIDTTRQVFEQTVRAHHYSRLPVVGTDRKTVVGIVDVFDVLADEKGDPVKTWLRPALVFPANESAGRALVQLRRARQTMAIVTDPRRGFVGIVTLKDVVEEIFGELAAW